MIEPQFDPETRKEIGKAVVIAALGALATGLVNWAIDSLKTAAKQNDQPGGPEGGA